MSRNLAALCIAMSSTACANWGAAAAFQTALGHAGTATLLAVLAAAQVIGSCAVMRIAA